MRRLLAPWRWDLWHFVTPGSSHDEGTGRYVVPVLAAYTASAPVVEITVPVLAAHAASGPLIENVVPIVGCSATPQRKRRKKDIE